MMNNLSAWWRLLRPHQWLKNVFILIGIIFGRDWTNQPLILQALGTVVAFSLLSSSIYIINDIHDRVQDQQHPIKKHRPIAAGAISITGAWCFATLLGVLSTGFGFWIAVNVGWILLAYIALNILYNLSFKYIVILDVFSIASGFMLRILAGTLGIGIWPSQWLMLCGLMLTLFLGFAKRRAEINLLKQQHLQGRKVLQSYNAGLLDTMIAITAGGTILTYSLYTMSMDTLRVHHTANLIYTVPCVMYGIFRYLYLLQRENSYDIGDIAQVLLRDKHLAVIIILWVVLTGYFVV